MEKTGKIKETAALIFEAMNSRDFTLFESNITDDIAFDFPGTGRMEGNRRTLLFFRSLLRKFPRLHFTINEVIACGDRACIVWTNEGEDAKGNPYANSGVTLIHTRDGKISFISDYFKDTSFVENG